MASEFNEFWNNTNNYHLYQEYYNRINFEQRLNLNEENSYRTHHQNTYQIQNIPYRNDNHMYYNQTPYIKSEEPSSCQLKSLQSCLENPLSSPPSTPNSSTNRNECAPKYPYETFKPCSFNEINQPEELILESPPKTPSSSSTRQEIKPSSPKEANDSPALRALLTRKDKNKTNVYQNNQKEINFTNYYEKANYYSSSFCNSPQNSYDSSECKEVTSPPMAARDGVNRESASSSQGAMVTETTTEYATTQQNVVKMAMREADIFPWMKCGKGITIIFLFKHFIKFPLVSVTLKLSSSYQISFIIRNTFLFKKYNVSCIP